jgi:hypothetical protein
VEEDVKHFVNLTNGIEALPHLRDYSFIRIQSTTLERKNYYKLFVDLDHNLLMWLALGYECFVYDFGTNRPVSKTIYLGLPIIEYCLNKYWLGYEMKSVMAGRRFQMNIKDYVESEVYSKLFLYHSEKNLQAKISLDVKYRYYRKFIPEHLPNIKLVGKSASTIHDSDIEFYKELLMENVA